MPSKFQVNLPGPREPGVVNSDMSDRELFVQAREREEQDELAMVPELLLIVIHTLL